MRKHLRYLRYVLAHKAYVIRAGLAIAQVIPEYTTPLAKLAWLWRLLVHDLSKFSRAEWTPYVEMFYGEKPEAIARQSYLDFNGISQRPENLSEPYRTEAEELIARDAATITRERRAAFNYAWLHHQHVQPHHWQHHILHEDSGKTIVLTPPRMCVDEMVADWLAAGPKALRVHTMPEAVAETIAWYAKAHAAMTMRTIAKQRAELLLVLLADRYGITHGAQQIISARETRKSITLAQ